MRVRRRLRKVLLWGTLVLVASLSGGLWFAYIYATDSETIARLIRAGAPSGRGTDQRDRNSITLFGIGLRFGR